MPISNKPTLYYLLSYVAFLIAFSVLIFFIKKKYSAHKITERAVSALGMKGSPYKLLYNTLIVLLGLFSGPFAYILYSFLPKTPFAVLWFILSVSILIFLLFVGIFPWDIWPKTHGLFAFLLFAFVLFSELIFLILIYKADWLLNYLVLFSLVIIISTTYFIYAMLIKVKDDIWIRGTWPCEWISFCFLIIQKFVISILLILKSI